MAWTKPREALRKLPEVLFQNRLSFTFDGIPLVAEDLSLRKKLNLLKVGLGLMLRLDRALGLPPMIQVEPSSLCNLKCPLCPIGTGTMKRQRGQMSFDLFQKILDETGEALVAVFLYSWGEPFLNKDLLRMVEACATRHICTLTDTNGHSLQTLDEALRVVDAGLSGVIIAMDGSTQEIYQTYRKSGDVEKVKRFTALLEEAKVKRGAPTPYTCLRTVVTRENEGDVQNMEKLARDLGVNMFSYKTVGMQTRHQAFREYEPTDGRMRRFEYEDSARRARPSIQCPFPFRQPTIFWDGTVVGCEYDYDLDMPWGRIGEQPFAQIWNSSQAVELRRSIRKGTRGSFCRRVCPYQDRVQDSSYLSCKELRPLRGD